ncbi:NADH-quinone oxidoreductase subunit C [Maridesulfovibrio sp.]|uniref:NADH-quinone oxidoreductase subunit C n=1 Tax=Maridesulfovibrio sp. TaxID=2795000 RepID=UPI002A1889A4|nr:NADH-quinone oxidoreductase subunit C [Maridesulfovibrio sp.]
MIENQIEVTLEGLVGAVSKMKSDGQRLVTFSCTNLGDGTADIIYHFDKDEVLTNLRLTVDMDKPVPSVSGVYFAALLIENEIQDQFDIKFDGLVLDFGRKLYLDDEITIIPMCNNTKAMTVKK